ncbi:MAG: DUF4388 domain-containing protein [Desulfuromonadales bacterium]
MSLVGNLEDLGLGEILQIVSLSRKSGVLSLQTDGKEGKVFFRDGQVIRANSSSRRENVGELLLSRELVDFETLREAVLVQQQEGDDRRLGEILSERFDVSRDAIETAVREQVEKIVYSFFSWSEGTFSFDLGDTEDPGETSFNPFQFMLDQGLNPQWLAMEGSRQLDEKIHRGDPLEDEEEEGPTFDIDDLISRNADFSAPDRSQSEDHSPASTNDNEVSLNGGGPETNIRDIEDQPAAAPDIADGGAEAAFNLGAELRREFGEKDIDPARGVASPGLHLLRDMLVELQNPSLGGGIILLVLRFASELMNRAVIFAVKDKEIVGLGQFGIQVEGENADARIRRIRLSTEQDSVFKPLVQSMTPMRSALGEGPVDTYIAEQLGGDRPEEVFLGPVLSEGKVVAILYGDNLPEHTEIGNTESLEIFLSQAGLAMEKAILERRLRVNRE